LHQRVEQRPRQIQSDKNPIVHEKSGWHRQPYSEQVHAGVVSRVLDRVFMGQPFDDDHESYGKILSRLRDNEPEYVRSRTVNLLLEQNKSSMIAVHGQLPVHGTPSMHMEHRLPLTDT